MCRHYILGGKLFFWIEKIFFERAHISRNVPTFTIRGVFGLSTKKWRLFSRAGTRKTRNLPSITYRKSFFEVCERDWVTRSFVLCKNKFRHDWNFFQVCRLWKDVGEWFSLTTSPRSPARSVLGAAPFQSLSDDQLNNFENLHLAEGRTIPWKQDWDF